MGPLVLPLIDAAMEVFRRVVPDKEAAAQAQMELIKSAQAGELQAVLAQIEVNKAEAAGGGFKAGWRPSIGYVMAAALGYQYVLNPLLTWACAMWAPTVTPPVIGMDEHLWELMVGMLGLAGWRTFDKIKGQS